MAATRTEIDNALKDIAAALTLSIQAALAEIDLDDTGLIKVHRIQSEQRRYGNCIHGGLWTLRHQW
jgi:hypothetical protein